MVAALLRLLHRTLRYEVVVDPAGVAAPPPALQVWCVWHRCILPCVCFFHRGYKGAVLISPSFDGELIARTLELLGHRAPRGSSSREGAVGLRGLAVALKEGYAAVLTADGPRGPIYRAKPGAVKLSEYVGRPIGTVYALPERAWTLRSWDRLLIPKPFSRVVISWGPNLPPPRSGAPEDLEAKRVELEAALERARLNAERRFPPPRP
jgi:lysophospholipid acyltransferase (LPLAT)-like uncharacterized protein